MATTVKTTENKRAATADTHIQNHNWVDVDEYDEVPYNNEEGVIHVLWNDFTSLIAHNVTLVMAMLYQYFIIKDSWLLIYSASTFTVVYNPNIFSNTHELNQVICISLNSGDK